MSNLVKFLSVSEEVRQRWRRRRSRAFERNWSRWWRKYWSPRKRPRWFREFTIFLYFYGKEVVYNSRHPELMSDING